MLTVQESPAKAVVNEGALHLADGDLDGAERLFREAVELDPANPVTHSNG